MVIFQNPTFRTFTGSLISKSEFNLQDSTSQRKSDQEFYFGSVKWKDEVSHPITFNIDKPQRHD